MGLHHTKYALMLQTKNEGTASPSLKVSLT